jgi:hypothetical protein
LSVPGIEQIPLDESRPESLQLMVPRLCLEALLCAAVPAPPVLGLLCHPETMLQLTARYRATFSVGSITAYFALLDCPQRANYYVSSPRKILSAGASVSPFIIDSFEREIGPDRGSTDAAR